jgi:hypothetical protein
VSYCTRCGSTLIVDADESCAACGAPPVDDDRVTAEQLERIVGRVLPLPLDRALDHDHSLCGVEPCSDCR